MAIVELYTHDVQEDDTQLRSKYTMKEKLEHNSKISATIRQLCNGKKSRSTWLQKMGSIGPLLHDSHAASKREPFLRTYDLFYIYA